MKKLMIAVAIVCAAVMSHGAAMDWMAFDIMDAAGENFYTGTAILTAWDSDGGSATFEGTVDAGMIMATAGDGSSATAGFFQQDELYSLQFTITDGSGNVFTSELQDNVMAMYPMANVAVFAGGSWDSPTPPPPPPIPEPTSGLMLLIGVAGLALRRKQK